MEAAGFCLTCPTREPVAAARRRGDDQKLSTDVVKRKEKTFRSHRTRHGYDSSFIRFNSVSESFDSTQLTIHNGFTGIDLNQIRTKNGILKFDSN